MAMSPIIMRPLARSPLPKRIGGLGLWLDANNGASLTLNGDGVSEWRDLSGRGRHFVQATAASQPNAVSRTYNGLRVIDFDGTQFLEGNSATLNLARNVPGLTILMVAKADSYGGAEVHRFYNWKCGGNDLSRASLFVQGFASSAEIWLRSRRLDSETFYDAEYEAGLDAINASVYTGVINFQAAESHLYVGGSLVASNLTMGTPGLSSDTDSQDASLGARLADGASAWVQHLDGFIAEMLVYQRVLSDLERSRLEQYLIDKWNPQPEPFSPGSLPGLVGWYDFSDASTLTVVDGEITAVANKGTGEPTATAFEALEPAFVASAQNGRSAARFPQNDVGIATGLSVEVPYTIFLAARQGDDGDIRLLSSETDPNLISIRRTNDNVVYLNGQSITDDKFSASHWPTCVTLEVSSLEAMVRYNGTDIASTATVGDWGDLLIGNGNDYESGNGDIYEVLVYEGILAQRERVEQYLMQKWDIRPVPSPKITATTSLPFASAWASIDTDTEWYAVKVGDESPVLFSAGQEAWNETAAGSQQQSSQQLVASDRGAARLDHSHAKFGNTSLLLAGGHLQLQAGVIDLSAGDWTIECWFRPETEDQPAMWPSVVSFGDGWVPGAWSLRYDDDSGAAGAFSVVAHDEGAHLTAGTPSPSGQWHHVAVVRDGDDDRLYVNGVLEATHTRNFTGEPGDYILRIGGGWDGDSADLLGHIDGLRIVSGSAIYTGPSFTVPAAAPTAISGTVLLMNFDAPATPSPRVIEIYPCDAEGNAVGQFTGVALSGNAITSLRAEGVSLAATEPGYVYQSGYGSVYSSGSAAECDLTGNLLSAQGLNTVYTDLLGGSGSLFVTGNPGIDADDPTIATAKGYTVFGSEAP